MAVNIVKFHKLCLVARLAREIREFWQRRKQENKGEHFILFSCNFPLFKFQQAMMIKPDNERRNNRNYSVIIILSVVMERIYNDYPLK